MGVNTLWCSAKVLDLIGTICVAEMLVSVIDMISILN